ncbi:MAG: hypothetical protein KAW12_11800 [Candidatus Aminicenantes bacterium]|nr:hypothetical protein [Candidatus Aminicenantes bacterium]
MKNTIPNSIKEHLKQHKLLYLSFLIFAIPFLITRLPFFLDYPVLMFDPDYLHYYMVVDQVDKGLFPTFIIRSPGYPLFLKLVFTFFNSNMAVVIIQALLSFLVPLFFIYTIYRVYRQRFKYISLLAAGGLAAFVSSSIHLLSDTTLLTESLYVNSIILFFALLIRGIHLKENLTWVFCSLSMAAVILIRPSGMFLIVVYLITALFLFLNSRRKKEILSFSLPVILILFLLSAYNYFTIGSFSFSAVYSEHALISFTSTFLETKESYPAEVNEIIEKSKKKIGPKHKKAIEYPWDITAVEELWNIRKTNRALRRHYNRNRNFIFASLLALEEKDSHALYLKWRPLLKDMAWTAIKKNPGIYLKYVYVNLFVYFFRNMKDVDFYEKLKGRYARFLTPHRYYKGFLEKTIMTRVYYKKKYAATLSKSEDFLNAFLKENRRPEKIANLDRYKQDGKWQVEIKPTFLQKLHIIYKKTHDFLFRNVLWVLGFFFVLVFSFVRLLKSRFSHSGALILFLLTLSALMHGLIISLSSFSILRYSYSMEFVYYLSLFLLPLILPFSPPGKKNGEKAEL